MRILKHLRYTVWPAVKVRLKFWWWAVKYGGKENIPPELVFQEMNKNVENVMHNLMQALRHAPDDMSKEEREQLLEAISQAGEMEDDIKRMHDTRR